MKRRGVTVLIGAILVGLLTWQAMSMRVAYVGLGPGPTVDTLGEVQTKDDKTVELITVDDAKGGETDGQLRLVTVRVHDHLQLAEAISYWLSDDYAVIPRQLQYPDDKSKDEISEEQDKLWKSSQSAAETAALRELGEPVEVTVSAVDSDSKAHGELAVDDVITAVEDQAVTSQLKLKGLLETAYQENKDEPVDVTVQRDDEEVSAQITPETADGEVTVAGIELEAVQDDPYGIEMHAEDLGIGGPSAGMIFALAMVEKASGENLTGGEIVAGTGEIDEEGKVGSIGGVSQKVVGAHEDGATVFLTPSANCQSAAANAPDGLKLIKIDTLDDAISALRDLQNGQEPQTC